MRIFRRDLIPRFCRESGRWVVVEREVDNYRLRNNDMRSHVYITVFQRPGAAFVLFQSWFSVRFSLEHEPRGLFARVLLRNFDLQHAGWSMFIGESCEACLLLSASVPRMSLDAGLLHFICDEILTEVNGLQHELHEKFRYSVERHDGGNGKPSAAEQYFGSGVENVTHSMRYQLPRG
jgi:hypothetical protein